MVYKLFRVNPLGFSIRVGIEESIMDADRYGVLWDIPSPTILKYIDNYSWVYAVIEYNHLHEIYLHSKHQETKGLRIYDQAIMAAASIFYMKVATLNAINSWRV